jgi:hypothetical protein
MIWEGSSAGCEFWVETSSDVVPVGKSSANESKADLPKFPERVTGAPMRVPQGWQKNPPPAAKGCIFSPGALLLFFAGCSVADCFLHNWLGKAMQAKRQLRVAAPDEDERALISTRTTKAALAAANARSAVLGGLKLAKVRPVAVVANYSYERIP